MKRTITIEGMTCSHCTGRVRKNLSAAAGVQSVNVDLASGTAVVESDESVTDAALKEIVEDSGYDVVGITA
jgi:copper chaperone